MTFYSYRHRPFLAPPIILLFIALFSAVVMLLWNAVITVIFDLPEINYWQAAGLLILARILFGMGHGNRHWHDRQWKIHLREKVSNMTPEERKEFFKKMHSRHHSFHHNCCEEKDSDLES